MRNKIKIVANPKITLKTIPPMKPMTAVSLLSLS